MKTVYTKQDIQERFAVLDNFRAQHGYKLGEKTAWFSGKNLISDKDIDKGICWHHDFINNVRFYSTFKISPQNFHIYWESLNEFKPDYIVGFPSSVYDLCEMANDRGLRLAHNVKVYFPNAETLLPRHREVISKVLGCYIVDQYSSSEGAPFIFECNHHSLHLHPLTGVFEVVDDSLKPTNEGKVLVTSFTTRGTPLIRYDIGDRLKLAPESKLCKCGSNFPIIDKIEGRVSDYVLSPDRGRVSITNIGNCARGINGLVSFQITQDNLDKILVKIVVGADYDSQEEKNSYLR